DAVRVEVGDEAFAVALEYLRSKVSGAEEFEAVAGTEEVYVMRTYINYTRTPSPAGEYPQVTEKVLTVLARGEVGAAVRAALAPQESTAA
ncbi:MAG TPA: hypothetical protein VJG29_00115, partial [Candidatus Paceibacterota bacterium]